MLMKDATEMLDSLKSMGDSAKTTIEIFNKTLVEHEKNPLSLNEGNTHNLAGRKVLKELQETIKDTETFLFENTTPNSPLSTLLNDSKQLHKKLSLDLRNITVKYHSLYKQQLASDRAKLLQSQNSTAEVTNLRKRILVEREKESMVKATKDVTSSLRKTRQIMAEQIERVASVSQVIDQGTKTLRQTKGQYESFDGAVNESKQILFALEKQARQEKIYIGAGFAVLITTVLYIIYERMGIPFLG